MPRLVRRHLPVITSRLRFDPICRRPRPLPAITARIDLIGILSAASNQPGPVLQQPNSPEYTSTLRHSSADTDEDSFTESQHPQPVTTDGSEDDNEADTETLIPKPPGEPGRPRSGGYNLQEQLIGWTTEFYDEVKAYVQQEAAISLKETRSFSHQNAQDIQAVCQAVARKYPILLKYDMCWPVSDMLKAHLKYTSEQARKRQAAQKRLAGTQRTL